MSDASAAAAATPDAVAAPTEALLSATDSTEEVSVKNATTDAVADSTEAAPPAAPAAAAAASSAAAAAVAAPADDGAAAAAEEAALAGLKDKHRATYDAMREQFPDIPGVDVMRFCRARKFDLKKASFMLAEHIKWRAETLPIPETDATATLNARKFLVLDAPDSEGRPIIYMNCLRFMQEEYDAELECRAFIYLLETQVMPRFPPDFRGPQTFCVIMDVEGIKMPPMDFLKAVGKIVSDNYPERLGLAFMIPVGWFIRAIVQACMIFVDPVTRAKYTLTDDVNIPLDKLGIPYANLPEEVHKLVDDGKLTAPTSKE